MKPPIICCDGTWNTPEMVCPTNVVKIAQAIPEVDGNNVQQIVFYDELYRKCRRGLSDEPAVFRAEHQTTIPDITFMGCWDTVESLGLPNKVDFIKIDNAFKDRYRSSHKRLNDTVGLIPSPNALL
ncbi:phospholipase effector Tle1 domain-containing protein [uncultured Desulfobacter sp.]|uniref:phospholipase effector Tle1 domain-containing protein n=1 Tax=uncultured Desulfobacter sp. TaxID=240139 RepID=UPI0029F5BE2C|nr:DUF2235 domain-containing protein [uncultured Desulfobacter sp.]